MVSVAVNPPKTPVTKGSNGIAAATVPNVCKMPGPPPPFVPTPLPNIGQTGKDPKDYSTTVKFDGNPVGIQGSSFGSSGDVASKGTGGGVVSSNCEGPTKFVGPGSLDVKVEGKRVQFLGDQTLNNCGPSGSPANSATLSGTMQVFMAKADERLQVLVNECDSIVNEAWDKEHPSGPKHDQCASPAGRGFFTSGRDKGKPIPVQVALGEEKERCVYDKMGATDGVPLANSSGKSVTVQQRFTASGAKVPPGGFGGHGSIVPDITYTDPAGVVAGVRDLKFPCPSGAGKSGQWRAGQAESYREILNVEPQLIFPI